MIPFLRPASLNKPVNHISRGCAITDIVNTLTIRAIQAQQNVKSDLAKMNEIPYPTSTSKSELATWQ